ILPGTNKYGAGRATSSARTWVSPLRLLPDLDFAASPFPFGSEAVLIFSNSVWSAPDIGNSGWSGLFLRFAIGTHLSFVALISPSEDSLFCADRLKIPRLKSDQYRLFGQTLTKPEDRK